jgi:hypothetical protein
MSKRYLFVNLIGGRQEIGNDLGYGKPKFFEPEEVKEISLRYPLGKLPSKFASMGACT